MEEQKITHVESDSSIEITKNSKGFTYSVKAYGSTPEQIKTKLDGLVKCATETIATLNG